MKDIVTSPYIPNSVDVEDIDDNKVKVSIYPFGEGFGITVAHPLRRLLYSSTVGYAPIAIKIEGVSHEFDSIRGILEDVSQLIMNLRNIRFKIKDKEAQRVEAKYSFIGPKDIKGIDLENSLLEVTTKELPFATLNESANLDFSIVVSKGIGYAPSEEIRDIIKKSDYISLDAFFTPVRKALYTIDSMLVEDNPNFEKISFIVETDGQISPMDAFENAVQSLKNQIDVFDVVSNSSESQNICDSKNIKIKNLLKPIDDLNLGVRSFNSLEKIGIRYIGEIVMMSEKDVKEIKNLGKKSFSEIKKSLVDIGFGINFDIPADVSKVLKDKIKELKTKEKK